MNAPLINYDLLYSPDPKRDNKPKPTYQSPASTSLKGFSQLKSPNSFGKPIFSAENPSKYYYITNQNAINPSNMPNFPEKPINKPIILPEKPNNYENFKVFARIRPFNQKELLLINSNKPHNFLKTITKYDETSVKLFPIEYQINIGKEEKLFEFDQVFDENDTNSQIFQKIVLSPIENLLNGYNSTILAYGMTGTGKTHTMFGDIYCDTPLQDPGLIILAIKDIFLKIEIQINENRDIEFKISLSYLEIYNEQVKDLLVENSENLMILEDQNKGVIIPDLSELQLNNPSEIIRFIHQGNYRRTMASTISNQFSSRSHAILLINIEKRSLKEPNAIIFAKFSLVDLAGSERALLSDIKGIRMTEGSNINKSLLALGNCINILSDINKKGAFVPYRDSKLTRLLKESLGGNTKTIMIACLSPNSASYEETLNTLKYANRAKNIKRKIGRNIREVEDFGEYKGIIEGLKNEIETLKGQLIEKKGFNEEIKGNFNGNSHMKGNFNENFNGNFNENFNGNFNGNEGRIKQINKELEIKFEGISQRILANLEDNWEIKQSVLELKNLQMINENTFRDKKRRLETLKQENAIFINYQQNSRFSTNKTTIFEAETLTKDLKILEENMHNNEKILKEMEGNLMKNAEKKEILQKEMLRIHEKNNEKLIGDLKLACDVLNEEKIEIVKKNKEIKRIEEGLVRLQEEKERTIKEMQREIEFMKKKLYEKDKIIEENNVLIKNLSINNQDLIKSSLKQKNYRSNTTESEKISSKLTFKNTTKLEDFPKNTSGIRQYFKGKSAENYKQNSKNYQQKSKEFQNPKNPIGNSIETEINGLISNRDSKGLRKNLDKLSECSSLTRFEAGNNDIFNKNSIILINNEENSPNLLKNKGISIENFEDIECTKKFVENLTEVSSILQEESQNFSVSDQIMIENLEKPQNIVKNHEKNIEKYEKNEKNSMKKLNENSFKKPDFKASELQNRGKASEIPLENQGNFYSNDYKLFLYKDRIEKAYNRLKTLEIFSNTSSFEINSMGFSLEIHDIFTDFNKTPYFLDEISNKKLNELRDFNDKNLCKNGDFPDKNRSNSANSTKETNKSTKKLTNKIVNTGSFIKTFTEKGFYENCEKNKKNLPIYVKYSSINLQENKQKQKKVEKNEGKKGENFNKAEKSQRFSSEKSEKKAENQKKFTNSNGFASPTSFRSDFKGYLETFSTNHPLNVKK